MTETGPTPISCWQACRPRRLAPVAVELRIFFGASAGVGKTYAMLEAARGARAVGQDIVVGYVEPHGRVETERLLEGLEQLPVLEVELPRHRAPRVRSRWRAQAPPRDRPGRRARALQPRRRRAASAARQALAGHRGAAGAGINVWTTVNVQHLESLNDLVAQITGVRQRETIPDKVFDEADEVELIDLPPDELLARLKAGKVYLPEQAGSRRSNDSSARQPARAARARAAPHGGSGRRGRTRVGLPTGRHAPGSRVIACWSPSDRMRRRNSWSAPASGSRTRSMRSGRSSTSKHLSCCACRRPSATVASTCCASRNRWARRQSPSTVPRRPHAARVCAHSQGVAGAGGRAETTRLARMDAPLHGDRTGARGARLRRDHARRCRIGRCASICLAPTTAGPPQPIHWSRYACALAGTAVCTAVAFPMYPYFELTDIVMAYMLGAAVAGLRLGRGPALLAAVAKIARARFLLRAATIHLRGARRPPCRDLRGDADSHDGDRNADGERPTADSRRRSARATHGAPLCDESRACSDTRHAQPGHSRGDGTSPRYSTAWPCSCFPTRRAGCPIPRPPPRLLAARSRSFDRTVGRRPQPARGPRIRHPACRPGALPAAQRRARHARRACNPAGESPSHPAPRTAPSARDLRRPDRRSRSSAPSSPSTQNPHASRPRQRACATPCLPRSRTICERRSRSSRAPAAHSPIRPTIWMRRLAAARAVDRDAGAGHIRSHLERARPDTLRVGTA